MKQYNVNAKISHLNNILMQFKNNAIYYENIGDGDDMSDIPCQCNQHVHIHML